ncbi:hypothetical protein CCH79_00001188, partial [Gambusia affinis]
MMLVRRTASTFSSSLSTAIRRPNSMSGSCGRICCSSVNIWARKKDTGVKSLRGAAQRGAEDLRSTHRQRFVKHSHQLPRQEAEDPDFPVGRDGGHLLPVGGEGQADGIGFVLGEFVQVRVRFVRPAHVFGEFELVGEARPVFQHSRFVGRHDDSESGVQADLGERRGVQPVEEVKGLVAPPAVVHEDLSCHGADGVARVVDPLTLTWMKPAGTEKNCSTAKSINHVDHVEVDHIEHLHGLIVPDGAEQSSFCAHRDALNHSCTQSNDKRSEPDPEPQRNGQFHMAVLAGGDDEVCPGNRGRYHNTFRGFAWHGSDPVCIFSISIPISTSLLLLTIISFSLHLHTVFGGRHFCKASVWSFFGCGTSGRLGMSNIYIQEPPTSGKVLLKTTAGEIDIELWSKEAPKACRNFVQLCMEGYYDGTIFHRVVPEFIIQGGDPTGTGTGGESVYGRPFKDEFHSRLRFIRRGLVAMANAGQHDNGSQFFFTLGRADELNNKHTIFGKVTFESLAFPPPGLQREITAWPLSSIRLQVTGDTIYNLLRLAEVECDANERPLKPHKIRTAEVLHSPFDDITPRETKKSRREKEKEEVKKSQSKATKNFNLLSFGEEAEEDEEMVTQVSQTLKGKSKSSHDLLKDDPRLSSVPAVKGKKKARPGNAANSGSEADDGDEESDSEEKERMRELISKKLKKEKDAEKAAEPGEAETEEKKSNR